MNKTIALFKTKRYSFQITIALAFNMEVNGNRHFKRNSMQNFN